MKRSRLWSLIEKKYVGSYSASIKKDPCSGELYSGGLNVSDNYMEEFFTGLTDINNLELFENDGNNQGASATMLYSIPQR